MKSYPHRLQRASRGNDTQPPDNSAWRLTNSLRFFSASIAKVYVVHADIYTVYLPYTQKHTHGEKRMNEDYFIEAGFDIITGENEMDPDDFAEMLSRKRPAGLFDVPVVSPVPNSDFSDWDDSKDMPF